MCPCILFQDMKDLPNRAHWYEFSTGWSFKCFFIWWLNLNPLSHRAQWHEILLGSIFKWFEEIRTLPQESQCYEFSTVWIFRVFLWCSCRWIPWHTEPRKINCPQLVDRVALLLRDAPCANSTPLQNTHKSQVLFNIANIIEPIIHFKNVFVCLFKNNSCVESSVFFFASCF